MSWLGTTLVQPVQSAGLRAAQRGETGIITDTSLARQPNVTAAYALGEATALEIPREHVESFVMRKPALLRLGRIIDERRSMVARTDPS